MPFPSWAAPQHGLQIQTRRKQDGQTGEQEEHFRPRSQLPAVSSCFVPPGVAGQREAAPHTTTLPRAAQHSQCPDIPATGGGNSSYMLRLFLSHHQLWLFIQWGRS